MNWLQQEARTLANRDRLLNRIDEVRHFDEWERRKERAADPLVPLIQDPFDEEESERDRR